MGGMLLVAKVLPPFLRAFLMGNAAIWDGVGFLDGVDVGVGGAGVSKEEDDGLCSHRYLSGFGFLVYGYGLRPTTCPACHTILTTSGYGHLRFWVLESFGLLFIRSHFRGLLPARRWGFRFVLGVWEPRIWRYPRYRVDVSRGNKVAACGGLRFWFVIPLFSLSFLFFPLFSVRGIPMDTHLAQGGYHYLFASCSPDRPSFGDAVR